MSSAQSISRLKGLGVATLVANWMRTLNYEIAFCGDERNDPSRLEFQHPAIFLLWHEYLQFTLYTHGFCGIKLLVSPHQDGEWLMQAAKFLGFDGIRGSSNRGAVRALREMLRHDEDSSISIAPDGPRGPRRQLAPGAIFLASKTQMPLVCIGLGYDRPWRIKRAWDQFAIPRPFSQARLVVGPKLFVPKKLGKDRLESYRVSVETMLNQLTTTAEDWAASGKSIEGAEPFHRQPRPSREPVADETDDRPATVLFRQKKRRAG